MIRRIAWAKPQIVVTSAISIGLAVVAQRALVDERRLASGLIIWAVALAFFLLSVWWARRLASHTKQKVPALGRSYSPYTEALLFAVTLLVGIFFRTYRLNAIPEGLNHDAAWNGLYAIRITPIVDLIPEPYVNEAFGRETLFHHIIALFQMVFGPSQLAIELAAVSVGVATLVVFYFLVRRLFTVDIALVASFLLSVSGWHMTFSRAGWRAILVPLFAALVFFFLVKAFSGRRPGDFILAGVMMGLSLYTYDAARIIPIAAALYILYEVAREPAFLRTHFVHLAALLASFLVSFAPMGWYALHHWEQFTGRGQFLWIGSQIEAAGSLEPLFINIKNAVLMYNFRANGNDFFIQEPLLDSPTSVFFVFGFVLAVLNFRRRPYLILLTLFFLGLSVGIASLPNGNRTLVTVLPAMAFSAIFIVEAWRWLNSAYPNYQRVFTSVLVALLVFTAYSSFDSYLGPNRRSQFGFNPEASAVANYAADHADNYSLRFVGGTWPWDTITYLTYNDQSDPFAPAYGYAAGVGALLEIAPSTDSGTAFIVGPTQESSEVIDLLLERYPAATRESIFYPDGSETVAYAVLVPVGGGIGADLATFTSPDVLVRDEERKSDLATVAASIVEYRERTGGVPSTSDNVEEVCFYLTLAEICWQESSLPPEEFFDPRGELQFGYWYASDGTSFTLYASLEGLVPIGRSCAAPSQLFVDTPNLYCVRG